MCVCVDIIFLTCCKFQLAFLQPILLSASLSRPYQTLLLSHPLTQSLCFSPSTNGVLSRKTVTRVTPAEENSVNVRGLVGARTPAPHASWILLFSSPPRASLHSQPLITMMAACFFLHQRPAVFFGTHPWAGCCPGSHMFKQVTLRLVTLRAQRKVTRQHGVKVTEKEVRFLFTNTFCVCVCVCVWDLSPYNSEM